MTPDANESAAAAGVPPNTPAGTVRPAMENTLLAGDFLLVNKAAYGVEVPGGGPAPARNAGAPARGPHRVQSSSRPPSLTRATIGWPRRRRSSGRRGVTSFWATTGTTARTRVSGASWTEPRFRGDRGSCTSPPIRRRPGHGPCAGIGWVAPSGDSHRTISFCTLPGRAVSSGRCLDGDCTEAWLRFRTLPPIMVSNAARSNRPPPFRPPVEVGFRLGPQDRPQPSSCP